MDKKFYVTPEMEETDLKMETYLQAFSGDPEFEEGYGDEQSRITFMMIQQKRGASIWMRPSFNMSYTEIA